MLGRVVVPAGRRQSTHRLSLTATMDRPRLQPFQEMLAVTAALDE
jgi:hypothetical protein